ncbi:GntR family transcriptional regulator [Shimia abyssi]|uniref:GntR family transcriptional regulator n=1 Tax=Shimia abyssi TaxID=1662395 RepID=A0A2P8FDJ4_9RHOB|nr:GntR family transcriptional regulator [Shimia abyssi]PSL19774.1 GntR family transcriptional regulator [Shimia abyssi]
MVDLIAELEPQNWYAGGRGSRYRQLFRHLSDLIGSGDLRPDEQLPSEREIAEIAGISRVTVRKAIGELANAGLIEQRRGAGSFVRSQPDRHEQSLSTLISFTENLEMRGITSSSKVLLAGLFQPTTQESTALGVGPNQQIARVNRLRSGDGTPMALEYSALPGDILPHPDKVGTSIYEILRQNGTAPTRALQRVTATNATSSVADLLEVETGTALLQIKRTAYLPSGRPIEYTNGYYRPDVYDFVSEIGLD